MWKKIVLRALLTILLMIPLRGDVLFSWGFFAHKRLNHLAVFTLPPEMVGLYKRNINYITEHAVDPDKRRYIDPDEAPRHYIDIDHYSIEHPFKVMPQKWKDAVMKYTEDTLKAYGIVPWHLDVMTLRLTKAFENLDLDRILRNSADIGHYMADAHVPLHTSENYDGQMTGQKGIHAFWESRIPELLSDNYDYLVGRAAYIDDPLKFAWKTVAASHAALDSVLTIERDLNKEWPTDQKYSMESRGTVIKRVYSREYSKEYERRMNGMVERRMRSAILDIGSIWYTCWVNAGQPDLRPLYQRKVSEQELERNVEFELEFNRSTGIKGREHED